MGDFFANRPGRGRNGSQVALTISRETTYITKPLGKHGYVDYLAALNERARDGVTPENNAVVPFLKAMGLDEVAPNRRDEYCRMLGVARLPDKGDYLVPLEKYTKQSKNGGVGTPEEFYKKLMRVTTRPWSKKEFPILADWLAANEKPVALLVEASKRPRRYEPLISGDGSVLCTLCPSGTQDREAARALAARAMLRLGEGKLSETWGDLLALHRLARLTGQGPTLIDSCIGSALEMEAFAGDRAVLEHIRLTAAQAAKMRNDLANLPPTPKVADKIDVGERFTYLDSVERLARGPLDKGVGDELGWKLKELFNSAASVAPRLGPGASHGQLLV